MISKPKKVKLVFCFIMKIPQVSFPWKNQLLDYWWLVKYLWWFFWTPFIASSTSDFVESCQVIPHQRIALRHQLATLHLSASCLVRKAGDQNHVKKRTDSHAFCELSSYLNGGWLTNLSTIVTHKSIQALIKEAGAISSERKVAWFFRPFLTQLEWVILRIK